MKCQRAKSEVEFMDNWSNIEKKCGEASKEYLKTLKEKRKKWSEFSTWDVFTSNENTTCK